MKPKKLITIAGGLGAILFAPYIFLPSVVCIIIMITMNINNKR
jgi:hypothetical protein